MILAWDQNAWEDSLNWQKTDKKILKRINELIREIIRAPFDGKGKPEFLKNELAGYLSRRINEEHRTVYKIIDERIIIIKCRFHYK